MTANNYRSWYLSCLLILLAGCQTLGVPTPQTFGERLAGGYTLCSGIRETALLLGQVGRITVADVENVQKQADNLRAGLDIARTLRASQPQQADQRLTATLTALAALDAYIKSRRAP